MINIALCNCAIVHMAIFLFRFCTFCEHFFYCSLGVYIIFERRKLRAHLKSLGKHDFLTNEHPMPHHQNVKNITMAKMLGKVYNVHYTCFSTFGAIELRRYPTNVGDEDDEEGDIAFVDVVP